jgi:hypothetical protein
MSEGGRSWRRVSRGVIWITFGTFLLLTTLDLLPWSYWGTLLPYWPVLLVMLGVRLIFERSAAPALILLSPVLLAGTMSFVAIYEPLRAPGEAFAVEAERPPEAARWRLEGELAMVGLDLRARPLAAGLLLDGEAIGNRGGPRVDVRGSGAEPRVRLRTLRARRLLPFQGPWWGELRADLAADLPVIVDLEGAATDGRIDLAAVPVERLQVEGAFHDLTILLGQPAEDTPVRVRGAFNRVRLLVPAETPVHSSRDGPVNVVDGRRRASHLQGPAYRLDVDGAFNWVEVSSPE